MPPKVVKCRSSALKLTHSAFARHTTHLSRQMPPTIVPVVLNEIDIASLLFGGASVLDAQSGFTGRFVSEGLRLSKSHAFRCFGVHQLRHTGRAPCGVQALDHHGFEVSALAQMQNVAKLDILGRFGGDVVILTRPF